MRQRIALLLVVCLLAVAFWRVRRQDLVAPQVQAERIMPVEVTEADVEVWREEFLDSFWDPPLPAWTDRLWEAELAALHRRAAGRATEFLARQRGRRFATRAEKDAFLRAGLEALRSRLLADPAAFR